MLVLWSHITNFCFDQKIRLGRRKVVDFSQDDLQVLKNLAPVLVEKCKAVIFQMYENNASL